MTGDNVDFFLKTLIKFCAFYYKYPAEHDPETAYFAFVVVKLQNLYFVLSQIHIQGTW